MGSELLLGQLSYMVVLGICLSHDEAPWSVLFTQFFYSMLMATAPLEEKRVQDANQTGVASVDRLWENTRSTPSN